MRRALFWVCAGLVCLASPVDAQTPDMQGPRLQAFLFGDVLYSATNIDGPEGFRLGQMVAHGNATLSQNVVFFGEVSLTARSTGWAVVMERAVLRYDFSDPVKISAGRYHTPISYWNTEFHHGLWLQGSVARPEAVRFGSQYIPVHFVGGMLEGNLASAPLYYSVGVGNGRSEDLSGAGDAGSVNGATAFIASASFRPRSLFGFRVGGAIYVDRISRAGADIADETIASGHVVWARGNVEAIAEFIHVAHTEIGGTGSAGSPSWYAHLGYRLPGALRVLTPYARFEEMRIAESDAVFAGFIADYEAAVLGVRYDFDDLAALKAEYRGEKFDGSERFDSFFIQASFAVPVSGG